MRHTCYIEYSCTLCHAAAIFAPRVYVVIWFECNVARHNRQTYTELLFALDQSAVNAPLELFDEYQFHNRDLHDQFDRESYLSQ